MASPTETSTPAEIVARVPEAFKAAHASGDVEFYDSSVTEVPGQFKFQVRLCPALGAKAKAKAGTPPPPEAKRARTNEESADRPSPFRPPYVPGLYVGAFDGVDGEEKMAVLLNKFAVVPEHFLLCPVVEQQQSLPPTPPQLARVYSIIQAASRAFPPKRLMAFYNGGPGAGASQRWRHVQFVDVGYGAPVEDWVRSIEFERNDRALLHPDLPYLHIVHPLPKSHAMPYPLTDDNLVELTDRLAPALMRTLDLAFDALRRAGGDRSQGWNLIMTLDHLHLIPRSSPSFALGPGQLPLEINSLGYAGMLLVRSPEEQAALEAAQAAQPDGLIGVIASCGIKREFGEQALEAEATQHGGAGAAFDGLMDQGGKEEKKEEKSRL